MQIEDPTAISDITPAMIKFMRENDKPAFAKYEAAKAALAELKAKNGSSNNVLHQVTKLLLEIAADSPQKAVVQELLDNYEKTLVK